MRKDEPRVAGGEERARKMVLYYDYIFKGGWPPRILVWAYHRMPILFNKNYIGKDAVDFYIKLANKREYFALLDEFNMKKTSYEETL